MAECRNFRLNFFQQICNTVDVVRHLLESTGTIECPISTATTVITTSVTGAADERMKN